MHESRVFFRSSRAEGRRREANRDDYRAGGENSAIDACAPSSSSVIHQSNVGNNGQIPFALAISSHLEYAVITSLTISGSFHPYLDDNPRTRATQIPFQSVLKFLSSMANPPVSSSIRPRSIGHDFATKKG